MLTSAAVFQSLLRGEASVDVSAECFMLPLDLTGHILVTVPAYVIVVFPLWSNGLSS